MPPRVALWPLINLLSFLFFAPPSRRSRPPTHQRPPACASSSRRRPALPPDLRPVDSGWGRFWQGTFITGFIRFSPWLRRQLVRRTHAGLAVAWMRDGEKRLNRLRRAAAVCRPSCNGAALDRFAWLSPWYAGCGGATHTRGPGARVARVGESQVCPTCYTCATGRGGWLRTCEQSNLRRSAGVEGWGCAGLSKVAAIAAVQRISRQGAAAAGVCAALRIFSCAASR